MIADTGIRNQKTLWLCIWLQISVMCLAERPMVARIPGLADPSESKEFISRLNYGVLAIKGKQVCLTEGYVTHMFHITLPNRSDSVTVKRNDTDCGNDQLCLKIKGLSDVMRDMTESMKNVITDMVDNVYNLIPDLNEVGMTRRRKGRGLIDGVGYAFSYLFGTSTSADIRELAKEINAIRILSGTAAADASRTREGIARFTRLTNERLDSMHALMAQEQNTVVELAQEIRTLRETENMEYYAINMIARELSKFTAIHDSVQLLYAGIEDLIRGQITPNLIRVETLKSVIANITQNLKMNGLRLCYDDIREVYNIHNFDAARSGNDLFIRLRMPYSEFSWISVYETETLHLPIPGQSEWTTIINCDCK